MYLGYLDGRPVYVGITNNVARRQSEHGLRFDYLVPITANKVTRNQALAIEQAMKNRHREFQNINNPIAKSRSIFDEAIQFGETWLHEHGY